MNRNNFQPFSQVIENQKAPYWPTIVVKAHNIVTPFEMFMENLGNSFKFLWAEYNLPEEKSNSSIQPNEAKKV